MRKQVLFATIGFLSFVSCVQEAKKEETTKLFELLDKDDTGISFVNQLEYDKDFNVFTYRNYYNGGGVSIGDINNDGLSDIYFTSNLQSNKLYLNKGNFYFEDISKQAGIEGNRSWSTGVNMVDVNADGLLDIYVCNSGDIDGDDKQNELFINNGNLTFTESAEQYGLADNGLSTHSVFFDYDNDGDLDAYVVNNSFRAIGSFNINKNERHIRDSLNGDRLYRNENGHFKDVSEKAGIYGSTIGFGLGVIVTDINDDGWQDIYVCNDFFERDYIYMNNTDGTFSEKLEEQMPSISMASMGIDEGDINNDGFPEIFVTEMLPNEESRLKTSMSFESWNNYKSKIRSGYHSQFTRNMFHLNNGLDANNDISFSEISRLEGMEASDWSWSVLMADLNLDGYKDIYITNGVYQDILNQDYLNYISSEVVARSMVTENGVNYKKLIDIIPSKPISNVAFSGQKGIGFHDSTKEWGLQKPGFSNGMAYGDLDNDGDLDLVVNNVNSEAFIYRNHTEIIAPNAQYLKVQLKGADKNTYALGSKVSVYQKGEVQVLREMPSRGFQSSVDPILNFGLKHRTNIDSIIVEWPTGKASKILDIDVNQKLEIEEGKLGLQFEEKDTKKNKTLSFDLRTVPNEGIGSLTHKENVFNDFDRDGMIFQMSSTEGPKMAIADVNGDGLEDVYLCGAAGFESQLFIQTKGGKLQIRKIDDFVKNKRSEDVDALFFDADQDGDQDLYVVSGGNEYPTTSSALSDRLYLNDGHGDFEDSGQTLPTSSFESTSCVSASDYDGDGDIDLFVGVRLKNRNYGLPQNGYILQNNGKGIFNNVSAELAPGLKELGMIKDAVWTDFNNDGKQDLIIVGEWMSIQLFTQTDKGFEKVTDKALSSFFGWWNTIEAVDLDNDGDDDYILGNHGLNSRFKASDEKPISCYINDFDKNGTIEQIICTYNDGEAYPLVLRHDLTAQLPYLKKEFLKYEDYKLKKIQDIFTKEQLSSSHVNEVNYLESAVIWNNAEGLKLEALPRQAQYSPIYAIAAKDVNNDGFKDLLLGGNLSEVKPEIGKYDASYGLCLLNDGKGSFKAVPNNEIGLRMNGQVRDIKEMDIDGEDYFLVAKNNDAVQFVKIKEGL
ncbi:VCBS repeat-containing protein [Maribacter sp. PR1]|uniref:VCBS repeat-containing protein n=1 Tax=Maribacter cobaltidurans TaxID=1178778 RepID=A0ABU7IY59_9FLAO|nr:MULTISPECIES: VCBS repeat-containing protein [Maribacter]MDC6390542.1 VCBS repeat-containing protein [Maribacter sp. PR1]MEE1977932.1 VCBS repeat-containing protein [Maribacter cobaltidurans]